MRGLNIVNNKEYLVDKYNLNEGKKKLNLHETIMKNYISYLKENKLQASFEQLDNLLEEQKYIIKKTQEF